MIPDHVLSDLKAEIVGARATGDIWNTERWLCVIAETVGKYLDPIPCHLCKRAVELGSVKNSCSYCAVEPGRLGWRWKPPIVVPEPDVMEIVAAPAGPRSDVPPSHPTAFSGMWGVA